MEESNAVFTLAAKNYIFNSFKVSMTELLFSSSDSIALSGVFSLVNSLFVFYLFGS